VKPLSMSLALFAAFIVLVTASPVFAQTTLPAGTYRYFGVGLTVIGAGYGIGKLAASALESMARQPELTGSLQTAMIIAAALIEGFTFFALYICMAY
jgi:F-type H+-transporting ATPase subunit c